MGSPSSHSLSSFNEVAMHDKRNFARMATLLFRLLKRQDPLL